ncbi:FAD/NAD-P-binding domain-containing protein [Lenzites betulinus]|nr:FAD/NAD-P-binding domain-containing protein [Lenzites betulinus]
MYTRFEQQTPDFMPAEFVVVGGAVTGLAVAIALSRVGHRVTVLEQMASFDETPLGGGCRLPPNATKLLYRWGMEERLRKWAIKSRGFVFAQFESGSVMGTHDWEDDVLDETGGDFLLMHYPTLRKIFADSAKECGATLRPGCSVVSIKGDPQRPSVTLASGEVLSADVVIGADGCYVQPFCCRPTMLKLLEQEDVAEPTGRTMFHAVIPESALKELEDEGLRKRLQEGAVLSWFGKGSGAVGFCIKDMNTGDLLFVLYVYTKTDDTDMTLRPMDRDAMLKALEGCDERLSKLTRHAIQVTYLPMANRPNLDEWVHPEGRIVVLGEAAHPLPVGSIYTIGLTVGDAAVFGRLFKHLHRADQIDMFLHAVSAIRAGRVERVIRASHGNIFAASLPPGVAEAHDRALRERSEREITELGVGRQGAASEEMVVAVEGIFAYDPEDEADDWWVKWGLMQERAARTVVGDAVSVHVDETKERA